MLVAAALGLLALSSPAVARPDPGVAPGPFSRPGPGITSGTGREVAEPAYISLLFSRSNWQAVSGADCSIVAPGARTLEQNAQDLADRGLSATALVVINRTAAADRTCFRGYTSQASWADLAHLRDSYGWSANSQGTAYRDMTVMTSDAERFAESAASLAPLAAHGFPRAWGSFAFANNKQESLSQAFVGRYFGFVRRYDSLRNSRAEATAAPYLMRTWSLNGGRCHNRALACYDMPVLNDRRSANVDLVRTYLNPEPGQWSVLQAYRLVEGTHGVIGDTYAWDCSSADWRDRWTSQPEISCRNSYLEMVDGRNLEAVVTDPTTIALAWGRVPVDYLGWPRP
ncbi:MAG TPA: hypothetical protein PLK69_02145 [Tetrasphaera sp.]|nr:hypothetical protein [Tetrasphaera sp.]